MSRADWKEGAVYRWSFKERQNSRPSYWCKSCIGIVHADGVMEDTYWLAGRNQRWTQAEAEANLDLEYVANLAELEKAPSDVERRYLPKDIVDLRHANGGTCYLRKGAWPSLDVERRDYMKRRDCAQRTASVYQDWIDRMPREVTLYDVRTRDGDRYMAEHPEALLCAGDAVAELVVLARMHLRHGYSFRHVGGELHLFNHEYDLGPAWPITTTQRSAYAWLEVA